MAELTARGQAIAAALKNGANIIRCHDTKEHIQATKVWGALQ